MCVGWCSVSKYLVSTQMNPSLSFSWNYWSSHFLSTFLIVLLVIEWIVIPTVPAASACPHFPTNASLQPFCSHSCFSLIPCPASNLVPFWCRISLWNSLCLPGWLGTWNTFVSTLESARSTWTNYYILLHSCRAWVLETWLGVKGNEEVIGTQGERSWDWVGWALWWRSGSMFIT